MPKRERYKLSLSVFLFIIKTNQIVLLKRSNTGWKDGYYSVPAGALEQDESPEKAVLREAKEEVNIDLKESDIKLCHTMFCHTQGDDWVGLFFVTHHWSSDLKLNEPHKHNELKIVQINNLPFPMIKYVEQALECWTKNKPYSEYYE